MRKRHSLFGTLKKPKVVRFDNSPKAIIEREINTLTKRKNEMYDGVLDHEDK